MIVNEILFGVICIFAIIGIITVIINSPKLLDSISEIFD